MNKANHLRHPRPSPHAHMHHTGHLYKYTPTTTEPRHAFNRHERESTPISASIHPIHSLANCIPTRTSGLDLDLPRPFITFNLLFSFPSLGTFASKRSGHHLNPPLSREPGRLRFSTPPPFYFLFLHLPNLNSVVFYLCGMLFLGTRHPGPGAERVLRPCYGAFLGWGDFGKTNVNTVRLYRFDLV